MLRNLFGFLDTAQRNLNLPTEARKPDTATVKDTNPSHNRRADLHGLYVDDSEDDLVSALETAEDIFSQTPQAPIVEVTPEPEASNSPPDNSRAIFLKIALQQSIENRLIHAGLLSPMQLKVITDIDRQQYPDLSLGEILLLRNWVKPETFEFFLNLEAELSPTFCQLPMEERLQKAGLVTAAQIQQAQKDRIQLNCDLEKILVLHGVINQDTADYFAQLG